MTQLTKHFSESEFTCRCGCQQVNIDINFVEELEKLREMFGKKMTITSGFRCASHNQASGGYPNSMHLKGRAADIYVPNSDDMHTLLRLVFTSGLNFGGIGIGKAFIHLDNRSKKRCWTY